MPPRKAQDPDERPRERLAARGSSSLTDTEIVALLLSGGSRGRSAVDVAAALLERLGGLRGLAAATPAELRAEPGVGAARSSVVAAACELARRNLGLQPTPGQPIASGAAVFAHLRARLALAPVEEFWLLGLDARHRIRQELCAARGSLTGVDVHPRDVFRPLIRAGAAAAIFCHNHPSGDPTPSAEDVELTSRLRQVGELVGIRVLDHVVVATGGFVSLAERGWA